MAKLRNFDWRQQACLLIETRRNETWKQDSSSFSDWLKKKAAKEGIQISTLWRYLNAAAFAIEQQIGPWATVNTASDIPAGISAEALELAEKIGRVAPKPAVDVILADIYQIKLKRLDLLKIWQGYRDALPVGTSARGRGVKRPVVDKTLPKHRAVVLKIYALKLLAQTAASTMGYPFKSTATLIKTRPPAPCDAVLIVSDEGGEIIAVDPVVIIMDSVLPVQILTHNFKNQRLWVISAADDNNADKKFLSGSSAHIEQPLPSTWGFIRLNADELSLVTTILSPADPIPLAARLAIQALK